jgi:hypothetical protein
MKIRTISGEETWQTREGVFGAYLSAFAAFPDFSACFFEQPF